MTNAVIFDMDGTLFQTDKVLERALNDVFDELRKRSEWDGETPIRQYRRIMGVPLPQVWETLLPVHSTNIKKEVDGLFLERLIQNIRSGNGALYPFAEELLETLNERGYTVLIASNGLIPYLNAIVEYYKLDRFVKETFSIERVETLHKSDLVGLAVDQYAISKGYVVGDRLSDFQAATHNGLTSIGCRFDFSNETELAHADHVVDDLRTVLEYVR